MKRLLLLFTSFVICFCSYSEDLIDKKTKLKEQIVINSREKNIDSNLLIEYAKLFLPENFPYDEIKMKTPSLSEYNYYWYVAFYLKNEYVNDDLFIDGVARTGYIIQIRKVTGEAKVNGWEMITLNDYQIQYKNFRQKINQFDYLFKDMKNYSQFCQFYKRINFLTDKFIDVTENNIRSYVDNESNEILKIKLHNAEEPLKEANDKRAISCIIYSKNGEELLRAYLLNDEDCDLLLIINDVSERKLMKYLISEKTNEVKEEVERYSFLYKIRNTFKKLKTLNKR